MLTQKQELFTLNLFKGMTQREAWIQAGYSSNYAMAIVDKHACELANAGKIKGRLAELRLPNVNSTKMLVQEREEKLSSIARDVKGDNIRAIQELNKMDGSYSPEKHLLGVIVTTPEGLLEAQERLLKAQQDTKALLEKFKGRDDASK